MHRFFQMVTRQAIPLLIAIFCITVFLSLQLPKLRIDTSVMRMLVEDLPAKRDYDRYRAEFGRVSDDIVVVFKAKSVFSQDAFDKISKLTGALKAVPGVKEVVSLSSLKDDLDILNEWTLKDLERNLNLADVFINNLVSADGKAAAIVVLLKDHYSTEETTQGIEAVLDQFRQSDDPLSVYQIGTPVVGHTLTEYTLRDFRTLPFFTMTVIFLVLLFCFRSFRGALIPFTAVCITLVWTFGLMGLMGGTLSMVTMIIPTLLIAVGSAYALHIMAAYFDEAARKKTHDEAVIQGLKRVCLPTIVASATTIVGFVSLLTNKIDIVREFALFSCLGLFIMLGIHLIFIPAALSRLHMPKTTSVFDPLTKSWIETLLGRITLITRKYPAAILVFSALTALVAGAGVVRIRVETSPISYFKSEAPVKMAFEDVHKHLAGIYPINVVLRTSVPGYFTSPKILQEVESLQAFLNGLEGVDVTVSVVDLLKFEGLFTRSFRDKEKYYVLPNDAFVIREAIKNFRMLQGDEFIDHFVSKDFSKINVTCRSHMVSTAEFIQAENVIVEYVRKHFPRDVEVDVTGLTMAVSHSSETVTMGQVKSLSLALVCIFILLSVLFLSPKVGLYAMMPNFFPIIFNFGMMGWLGIHLSVATSLIASIAIGLSVDDTIHYVFRFNQELKKDLSRRQAMARTTTAVGKPIVFTSLTIGLGFSVLLFSSFVPTMVFGFLMLVTVTSALIGDLFIMPAILLKIQLVTLWDLLRLKLGKDPREGIPLFQGLSRSQVHYILMAGVLREYANGDILFRKGDISDSMYAVISGQLDVFDEFDSDETAIRGTSKLISTLGTGDVVGEMGMVRHCQRSATVVAKERTELLEINEKMIRRLQWLFPPTAQKFFFNLMTMICNRLEDTTKCLSDLTTLDGESGLHDRAYFENILDREIVRARRYNLPLSILLMVFDHLNDLPASSDRETGRGVLAEAGRILKSKLRRSDTPCRFGVDHFAVILPNSDEEDARRACKRLRKIFEKQPFRVGSMGFAVLDPNLKESAADLIAKALQALQH
jgi:hydrophobe/amphiphile efflux-3 (HAE3) family protein